MIHAKMLSFSDDFDEKTFLFLLFASLSCSSFIHIFLWMVLFIRKGNLLKIITTFLHAKKKKTCKEQQRKLIFFFVVVAVFLFLWQREVCHWNWCNIYYDFYKDWRMFCSITEKISIKRKKSSLNYIYWWFWSSSLWMFLEMRFIGISVEFFSELIIGMKSFLAFSFWRLSLVFLAVILKLLTIKRL